MNGKTSLVAGAVAGVIAALLIFVSLAAVDPSRGSTDAELLDWWASGSNLDNLVLSMYARLLAVPFLLAFLVQLRSVLRSSDEGGWSDLAYSAGIISAVMLAISGLARGVTAQMVTLEDEPLPGVDTLRLVTEFSYQAYSIAFIGMLAVTVAIAGLIVVRTKTMAPWLGWISLPIAGVTLVAVAAQMGAFASPLLLIWVLAASFCLARKSPDASTVETHAPAPVPQTG